MQLLLQLFKDRIKMKYLHHHQQNCPYLLKVRLAFQKDFSFFMMIFKSLFNEWGFKLSALVPSTRNPTKNECCMDKFLSTKQWL